jgi:hypothetical protein
MAQTIAEILGDLRSLVNGRGREDNFCYSKVYSSSSGVRCIDFSRWVGMHLAKNDTYSLAVFMTQLNMGGSFGASVTLSASDDVEDVKIEDEEEYDEKDGGSSKISFDREVNRYEQEIKHILQFPFEEYFVDDIRLAKLDLLIAWLVGYSDENFAKIMMPYSLEFKNANTYLERYNQHKKKQLKLPTKLPSDVTFIEFQRELSKLPFATRLHLFDVFEYSGFGKKSKLKPFSDMTLYNTRAAGIDEKESADILRQSKLVTSFPDGTGFISHEYVAATNIALDYAKKIVPVYYEWKNEVAMLISDQLGTYFYALDPANDSYLGSEEFEEDDK